MNTRLFRSKSDRMLAGVCGGLGQYLGIDSSIVRVFFVLLAIGSGLGGVVYLVLWMILPREGNLNSTGEAFPTSGNELGDRARQMGDELREAVRQPDPRAVKYIGFALIGAGLLFFVQNLHLPWLQWLNSDLIWPVLLIMAGAAFLYRATRGDK